MTNDVNALYFLPSAVSILSFIPANLYSFPSRYVLLCIHRWSKAAPLLGLFLIYLYDFRLFIPLFHLHVEEDTSVSFYLFFIFLPLPSIHFHLESHLLRCDSIMTVHSLLPYSCTYTGLLQSVLVTIEHCDLSILFGTHINTLSSDGILITHMSPHSRNP